MGLVPNSRGKIPISSYSRNWRQFPGEGENEVGKMSEVLAYKKNVQQTK